MKDTFIKTGNLLLCLLLLSKAMHAQWLPWEDNTAQRLVVTSVANSDPEEKDMWAADFDNDGHEDVIVVRKQPFSSPTQPGKSTLLLMNLGGVLTDQTALYAPQFISTVSFARDVYVVVVVVVTVIVVVCVVTTSIISIIMVSLLLFLVFNVCF